MRTLTCDPCGPVLRAASALLAPAPAVPAVPPGPALLLFVRHFG